MISAGNDIVALKAVDIQRTNLPAFYSKFITPDELKLYNPHEISFVNFVWLLWSVKESVYKYLKRMETELVFSPVKIVIQQLQPADAASSTTVKFNQPGKLYSGIVTTSANKLHFKSTINKLYIASIIDEGNVYWDVKDIRDADYQTQSNEVRLMVLDKLNDLIISDDLWIKKDPIGYPVLFNGTHQIDIPISFAHHDCYVSYAFQIPK